MKHSLGIPVISNDLPCVRDFLNEENSIKFKIGDSKELAHAIDKFFNLTNDEKKMMEIKGRELISSKYSWKYISEQLIELFDA
ncbi:MAG: glycosyltransferase [Candidatus Helarchaeota archaeon]